MPFDAGATNTPAAPIVCPIELASTTLFGTPGIERRCVDGAVCALLTVVEANKNKRKSAKARKLLAKADEAGLVTPTTRRRYEKAMGIEPRPLAQFEAIVFAEGEPERRQLDWAVHRVLTVIEEGAPAEHVGPAIDFIDRANAAQRILGAARGRFIDLTGVIAKRRIALSIEKMKDGSKRKS